LRHVQRWENAQLPRQFLHAEGPPLRYTSFNDVSPARTISRFISWPVGHDRPVASA
jgi:hypothetical protein